MKFLAIMDQEKDYYSSSSPSSDLPRPESADGTEKSSFNMQKFSFDPGLVGKSQHESTRPSPMPHAYSDSHEVVFMEYAPSTAYPHFGSGMTTYAHNNTAIYHPHILGFGQERVALPVGYSQDMPIYVNAKQYHAILRRRQTRAKLEARNKVAKSRKPYLHESRHLHALKRARGSGGRFLNTKDLQTAKISNHSNDDDGNNFSYGQYGWRETSDAPCPREVSGIFRDLEKYPSSHHGGLRGLSLTSFLSSARAVKPNEGLRLSIVDERSRISTT